MPRTTIARSKSTSVTTSEINLLDTGAITAGSVDNTVPLGDVESYAIVIANTGGVDITVRLYLGAGSTCGPRAQSAVTATVGTGTTWSYQLSGNAMRSLALTGQTAAGSTTIVADFIGVVYR